MTVPKKHKNGIIIAVIILAIIFSTFWIGGYEFQRNLATGAIYFFSLVFSGCGWGIYVDEYNRIHKD